MAQVAVSMPCKGAGFRAAAMILHKAEKRKLDGDDVEILAAGRQGLEATLTRLLRQNIELVYARDSFWNTPLILACREGKLKVAQQLVEAGSSVNSTNRAGQTSLFLAAARKDASILKMLLEHDADPNIAMGNGWTPLYQCCVNGSEECGMLLLNAGANPNVFGRINHTALIAACVRSGGPLTRLVLALMEKGAEHSVFYEPPRKPDQAEPLILRMCYQEHFEIVEAMLAKGANIDEPNLHAGATALMIMNESKELPLTSCGRALRLGADPDAVRSNDGLSCFHLAIQFGRWAPAALLMIAGAKKLAVLSQAGHDEHTKRLRAEHAASLKTLLMTKEMQEKESTDVAPEANLPAAFTTLVALSKPADLAAMRQHQDWMRDRGEQPRFWVDLAGVPHWGPDGFAAAAGAAASGVAAGASAAGSAAASADEQVRAASGAGSDSHTRSRTDRMRAFRWCKTFHSLVDEVNRKCIRPSGVGVFEAMTRAVNHGMLNALKSHRQQYRLGSGSIPTASVGLLHRACMAKSVEGVKQLLEFGFPTSALDSNNKTPSHYTRLGAVLPQQETDIIALLREQELREEQAAGHEARRAAGHARIGGGEDKAQERADPGAFGIATNEFDGLGGDDGQEDDIYDNLLGMGSSEQKVAEGRGADVSNEQLSELARSQGHDAFERVPESAPLGGGAAAQHEGAAQSNWSELGTAGVSRVPSGEDAFDRAMKDPVSERSAAGSPVGGRKGKKSQRIGQGGKGGKAAGVRRQAAAAAAAPDGAAQRSDVTSGSGGGTGTRLDSLVAAARKGLGGDFPSGWGGEGGEGTERVTT